MFTLPVVLSGLGLLLTYAIFQFGLFKWLIGRIDTTALQVKQDLLTTQEKNQTILTTLTNNFTAHQLSDTAVFGEIQTALAKIEGQVRRKRAS